MRTSNLLLALNSFSCAANLFISSAGTVNYIVGAMNGAMALLYIFYPPIRTFDSME